MPPKPFPKRPPLSQIEWDTLQRDGRCVVSYASHPYLDEYFLERNKVKFEVRDELGRGFFVHNEFKREFLVCVVSKQLFEGQNIFILEKI